MSTAVWPFIRIEEDGMAFIEGTTTKVIEVALDRIAHHWDADEIHRQHPHLSLAQIHSALSYYYDNQQACDELIHQRYQRSEELCQKLVNPILQERLRQLASQ